MTLPKDFNDSKTNYSIILSSKMNSTNLINLVPYIIPINDPNVQMKKGQSVFQGFIDILVIDN